VWNVVYKNDARTMSEETIGSVIVI
jgi:hypothetical protein